MLTSYKSKTQKVEAIKSQLKFRKEVLLQKPENISTFNVIKTK